MRTRIAASLFVLAVGVMVATSANALAQEPKAASSQEKKADKPAGNDELVAKQMATYPLATCPISGEKLGADAVNHVHEGRLVRFCCNKCVDAFKKDPSASLKKINEAAIAAQKAAYPMEKCPVSGEKLGDGAVNYVYGTRLVRFCCEKCVAAFNKEPDPYVKKLDSAYIASQQKSYPLDHCLVMEESKLTGPEAEPVDYLYGNRLVRFCCKKCIKEFNKQPDKYIAKLDEAAKQKK